MRFHKEGYTSLALCILFIFVLNALIQFYFPDAHVVKWIVYILSFALFVTIVQFFRSPVFAIDINENHVLCPADGKVVVIEETDEPEFLKDRRIQLSVFMSPVNVHVNRNPISGFVKYFKYHPGKYLVAWHPKSSTENERTTVVTENSQGVQVLFRQIAGALARRIVWYVKEGDTVKQGDQFGFIKFGSRVDVFLPLGTKINVQLDQVVKGGRTVLAELTSVSQPLPDITSDVIEDTIIPEHTEVLTKEHAEPTLVIEHEEVKQAVEEASETTEREPAPVKKAPAKPRAPRKPSADKATDKKETK
jgi:phosphatidylserine decarboxylase